jgi:hypothetical protein
VEAGDSIAGQAAHLRASGALGRSELLLRLFDYLVESSTRGDRPKEVEIALTVFGRGGDFDGGRDASVRVAAHRLRKKLDAFYADAGRDEPVRLTMPVGEYRLALEPQARARPKRRPAWPWIAAAVLLVTNLATIGGVAASRWNDPAAASRRLEPWRGLTKSQRPLIIAVGDYYIFGEVDPQTGAGRLVREYGVNSHEDLETYRLANPQQGAHLRDLDLYYLPVGAAHALRAVLPLLTAAGETPQVVTTSSLTTEMLRRNDIVYVGYLSGLGPLRDPVFAGSRFRVGDTWDELIDARSGRSFVSQQGGPGRGPSPQQDYGYLASLPGPEGGRILIIAGMRDVGLMQAAEAAARREVLAALRPAARYGAFEALIEANGMHRTSLGGRLLLGSPLDGGRVWSARPAAVFPAG